MAFEISSFLKTFKNGKYRNCDYEIGIIDKTFTAASKHRVVNHTGIKEANLLLKKGGLTPENINRQLLEIANKTTCCIYSKSAAKIDNDDRTLFVLVAEPTSPDDYNVDSEEYYDCDDDNYYSHDVAMSPVKLEPPLKKAKEPIINLTADSSDSPRSEKSAPKNDSSVCDSTDGGATAFDPSTLPLCTLCLSPMTHEDPICAPFGCEHVRHSNCLAKWYLTCKKDHKEFLCDFCKAPHNLDVDMDRMIFDLLSKVTLYY